MQMAVNNGVINQINSKSAPLNESARSPRSNKLNSASLSDAAFFSAEKNLTKKTRQHLYRNSNSAESWEIYEKS